MKAEQILDDLTSANWNQMMFPLLWGRPSEAVFVVEPQK
jgi:hypothetical protein